MNMHMHSVNDETFSETIPVGGWDTEATITVGQDEDNIFFGPEVILRRHNDKVEPVILSGKELEATADRLFKDQQGINQKDAGTLMLLSYLMETDLATPWSKPDQSLDGSALLFFVPSDFVGQLRQWLTDYRITTTDADADLIRITAESNLAGTRMKVKMMELAGEITEALAEAGIDNPAEMSMEVMESLLNVESVPDHIKEQGRLSAQEYDRKHRERRSMMNAPLSA